MKFEYNGLDVLLMQKLIGVAQEHHAQLYSYSATDTGLGYNLYDMYFKDGYLNHEGEEKSVMDKELESINSSIHQLIKNVEEKKRKERVLKEFTGMAE